MVFSMHTEHSLQRMNSQMAGPALIQPTSTPVVLNPAAHLSHLGSYGEGTNPGSLPQTLWYNGLQLGSGHGIILNLLNISNYTIQ